MVAHILLSIQPLTNQTTKLIIILQLQAITIEGPVPMELPPTILTATRTQTLIEATMKEAGEITLRWEAIVLGWAALQLLALDLQDTLLTLLTDLEGTLLPTTSQIMDRMVLIKIIDLLNINCTHFNIIRDYCPM